MQCIGEQHLALDQRFPHQAELVVLEIAQTTMDELGAGRGGGAGEIGLLDQQHAQTSARGITGNASAVDAAPDDQQIDGRAARVVVKRQTLVSLWRRRPTQHLWTNGSRRAVACQRRQTRFERELSQSKLLALLQCEIEHQRPAATARSAGRSVATASAAATCRRTSLSARSWQMAGGGSQSVKKASRSRRLPSRTMALRPNLV